MAAIRLLSTDFDGTLIGHPSDGRCSPALAAALSDYKQAGGLWAVNTGRSRDHADEGLALFDAPVDPDFLLTNEREVFRRDDAGGWVDFGDWNRVCHERHAALFLKSAGIFDRILAHVEDSPDVTIIHDSGDPVGLVTTDEAVMEIVTERLHAVRTEFPDFNYQRNTIYLRFCHVDYHKGSALAELSRLLGLIRTDVLAAGDHYNDIPMLDGIHAAHVACPANAIPPVQEMITNVGGYIAKASWGDGIAEAIRYFHEGHAKQKPAAPESAAG